MRDFDGFWETTALRTRGLREAGLRGRMGFWENGFRVKGCFRGLEKDDDEVWKGSCVAAIEKRRGRRVSVFVRLSIASN